MKFSIKIKHRPLLVTAGLCLFSGFLWISLWIGAVGAGSGSLLFKLQQAEWQMQDWLVRGGPPARVSDKLVYLGIDSPNYEYQYSEEEAAACPALAAMRQQYPWPRKLWAELIQKMADAGAKVVIFDILFASPSADDPLFKAAIHRYADRVILAANINVDGSIVTPSSSLSNSEGQWGDLIGIVNFFPDPDGTIRRALYQTDFWGQTYDSLAKQAVRKLDPERSFPALREARRIKYGGPSGTYPVIPLYQIFLEGYWKGNFQSGAFFKDKVVMVGPAANWTQDLHTTPHLDKMFGPEVHLHAISALLNNNFIDEVNDFWQIFLIFCSALMALLFFAWVQRPELRFGFTLVYGVIYLLAVRHVYHSHSLLLLVLAPLLSFGTAATLCLVQSFAATLLEKIRTRSMLERYVSQNFVKEILDHPGDFEESLGGTRKTCVMLFSDIRGFTTMTESSDSQALVTQLNEYLSQMVECVFRNHGTLDKFIGDAVMAVWGNVQSRGEKQDALDAVHTALEMLTELKTLNRLWPARSFQKLQIGIGINHGEVVVGNIGSPRRKEFTVIGDPVNLASRLEGVTKEYGLELVIGESTAALVEDVFYVKSVDLIRVKGKVKPIKVFTVLGKKTEFWPDARIRSLASYEKAVGCYRAAQFAEALALFEEVAGEKDLETMARLYMERCRSLMENPPEKGTWDGVWVMTSK
jgi:adenylate cyclase